MKKLVLAQGAVVHLLLVVWASAALGAPRAAEAELKDAQGKKVGTVSFLETPAGVQLSVRATGLTPGEHGIHVHQNGKCEGSDFKSAGDHLAGGEGAEHGLTHKTPHAGDLPNLRVGEDGTAVAEMLSPRMTLRKGERSLLKEGGAAVVIHEKSDDQRTDPSGKSGGRIACGVITPKG